MQFHRCFRTCWVMMESVCLWTTTAQLGATAQSSLCPFFCQWHHSLSQEQRKLNTAGSMGEKWDGERHSAKHNCSSHQCMVFASLHVCVCFCVWGPWVCVTLLSLHQFAELISSTSCLPATLWVRASAALTSGHTSVSKCFHLCGKWHTFTHTVGHQYITNRVAYKH